MGYLLHPILIPQCKTCTQLIKIRSHASHVQSSIIIATIISCIYIFNGGYLGLCSRIPLQIHNTFLSILTDLITKQFQFMLSNLALIFLDTVQNVLSILGLTATQYQQLQGQVWIFLQFNTVLRLYSVSMIILRLLSTTFFLKEGRIHDCRQKDEPAIQITTKGY